MTREEAFQTACRLMKEAGTSAWAHLDWTLKLATWLLEPSAGSPANAPTIRCDPRDPMYGNRI